VNPGEPCTITLEGIEVFAHHGVLPEEKERGQEFIIDVRLDLSSVPAADDIASTVDYARVASRVVEVSTGSTYDLIETLAAAIADDLLSFAQVRAAMVTVKKPSAPMQVRLRCVSATVSRVRPGTRAYLEGGEE
jgi:dihydroneopterin aldolase